MIADDGLRAREPERGDLGQHFALVRYAGAEHVVERGDAIGGDDQQLVAEIVDVADLARSIGPPVRKRGLKNGRGEGQHGSDRKGWHLTRIAAR